MAAIVYIENGNIANQIHGFTIDYGKFILIMNIKYLMISGKFCSAGLAIYPKFDLIIIPRWL